MKNLKHTCLLDANDLLIRAVSAAKLDEITTKVKEALKARGALNIQHLANAEVCEIELGRYFHSPTPN